MSVQQVWRFMHRILQVHKRRKFTSRLSWTMQKIYKYKDFLWVKFSRTRTESKDIYRKICIRKTCIFTYFTQYDVFHLLARKLTHYWTRIIDITLKIVYLNNWFDFLKSIFNILIIFSKKPLTFKDMSLRSSINSSKYVHFSTLVLKTILILMKFPFQQDIK